MKTQFRNFKVGDYVTVKSGGMNDTGHSKYSRDVVKTLDSGDTVRIDKFVSNSLGGIGIYDATRKQVYYFESYYSRWRKATDEEIKYYNNLWNIRPEKRFKVGDEVTVRNDLGEYHFGGNKYNGVKTTIQSYSEFKPEHNCWKVYMDAGNYAMLESEFEEYDQPVVSDPETEYFKSKVIRINGRKRQVSVMSVLDGNTIRIGYAIKRPEDSDNSDLAKIITRGRALNSRKDNSFVSFENDSHKADVSAFLKSSTKQVLNKLKSGEIDVLGVPFK